MKSFFLNHENGEAVNVRIIDKLSVKEKWHNVCSKNAYSSYYVSATLSTGQEIAVSSEYKTYSEARERIKDFCAFV